MFFRAVFVVFWNSEEEEEKRRKKSTKKAGERRHSINGKRKDTKCDSTRFLTDENS